MKLIKSTHFRNIILFIIIFMGTTQHNAFGAQKKIKGIIYDSNTHELLPFVSIWIKGTTKGTTCNENGEFDLTADISDKSVIVFSYLGYKNKEVLYSTVKNQNIIKVYMTEETLEIEEIVVKPDNSQARALVRAIIKNKKHNNFEDYDIADYKEYTRRSVFLCNLNKDITERKIFKSSADAFIMQSDSTVAMPIFLSEQHISHKVDKNQDLDKHETLKKKAECVMPQLQNIVNTVVSRKITSDINFYNNQIVIMQRGFPSPVAWNNQLFYNIYLTDSTVVNGVKRYKLDFYPKSYRSTAFKGHLWVDSKTYAITEIHAKLPNSANVNFVNEFEAHIFYKQLTPNKWFPKLQKIKSRLTLSKSEKKKKTKLNFTVQKITDYHDIVVPENRMNYMQSIKNITNKSDLEQIESYQIIPYDSLEVLAYNGINKLKDNKTIKHISRFSDMTLNGYYNLNKIDIGSYMDIYRRNEIEGSRLTLPMRTSEKLFKNFSVGGYIGYGFKDKAFKYGGKLNYKLNTKASSTIALKYDYDYYSLTNDRFVEFIRENPYEAGGGNVISSVTTRVPNPYMIKQQKISFTYESQFNNDIGLLLRPFYGTYYHNYNIPFIHNGTSISKFNNYGLMADVRFSFGQPFDEGFFYKIYYGNDKPVIHLSAIVGNASFKYKGKNINKTYANINASMKSRINIGPAFIKAMLNAGYIMGDVPYPLLHASRGTRDLGFARYHYNLLHNTSFVSDLYTNVHISLNGGGTLFGKLPLIKKLNLRETLSFKSFWGKLRNGHKSAFDIPHFVTEPTTVPYMEVGAGITNIFKVIRVEYITRINSGDIYNKFSSKHGVRLRIEVSF